MGSADGFVRDGWHEKAVVDAENTVGNPLEKQCTFLIEISHMH